MEEQKHEKDEIQIAVGQLMKSLEPWSADMSGPHLALHTALQVFLDAVQGGFVDLRKLEPGSPVPSDRFVWRGAKFRKIPNAGTGVLPGKTVVTFKKLEGDWPSFWELMSIAAGRVPGLANYFGGSVEIFRTGDIAEVTVRMD